MATHISKRPPRILAIGGGGLGDASVIDRHVIDMSERDTPRICLLPASGPAASEQIARFYDVFGGRAEPSHLPLDGASNPPDLIRRHLLAQDVVYAGGGGLLDVLSRWRAHGVDGVLREAWRSGVVLAGTSAGAICWFEAGVTDSFREELDGLDCLGFLPGSSCPHYDGEETRRPAYHRLVRDGFPSGYAAGDGCGLLFRDTELAEVVSERDGARAYRVELVEGEVAETPLEARRLA